MSRLSELLSVMAQLRDPVSGCAWDQQQTFASIAPYTIEEAYEVADAIERGQLDELRDELGDLLLQVVFHAQMADEAGHFNFEDVAASIVDKLIRRHPHVFGDNEGISATAAEVKQSWEAIKAEERHAQASATNPVSVLDGVALNLPALTRAEKIQKRAARVGFDWPTVEPVYDKVVEELEEVREAAAATDNDHTREEVGDLFFAAVNLARQLNVDPETALRQATLKFDRRFRAVEQRAAERQIDMQQQSLPALDALWDEVKQQQQADNT